MTLTDTGPIVALIDESDANHSRCYETVDSDEKAGSPSLAAVLRHPWRGGLGGFTHRR